MFESLFQDAITHAVIEFTAIAVPAFMTWGWAVVRKNQKARAVLNALQIDSAKEELINKKALSIVKSIEEQFFQQLKENRDHKLTADEKEDMALEKLKMRFPDVDNDELSDAIKAAVAEIRPTDPLDRVVNGLTGLFGRDQAENIIAPEIKKMIDIQVNKGKTP